jgi:hypothetical protein
MWFRKKCFGERKVVLIQPKRFFLVRPVIAYEQMLAALVRQSGDGLPDIRLSGGDWLKIANLGRAPDGPAEQDPLFRRCVPRLPQAVL